MTNYPSFTEALLDEAVRRALGGHINNMTIRTPALHGALPAVPDAGMLTNANTGEQYFMLDDSVLDGDTILG